MIIKSFVVVLRCYLHLDRINIQVLDNSHYYHASAAHTAQKQTTNEKQYVTALLVYVNVRFVFLHF